MEKIAYQKHTLEVPTFSPHSPYPGAYPVGSFRHPRPILYICVRRSVILMTAYWALGCVRRFRSLRTLLIVLNLFRTGSKFVGRQPAMLASSKMLHRNPPPAPSQDFSVDRQEPVTSFFNSEAWIGAKKDSPSKVAEGHGKYHMVPSPTKVVRCGDWRKDLCRRSDGGTHRAFRERAAKSFFKVS